MNPRDCICSVCGIKGLELISKKYSSSEHYSNSNKRKHPLRGIMVCKNPKCKSSGKGFWSVLEGEWHSYTKSDPELIGLPLSECCWGFGDKRYPADLWFPGLSWKENNAKYRKGVYIGENWKSKLWRKYGLLKNKLNMWRFKFGS